MYYVYCGSYFPLLFALYLRGQGKEIKIITGNKDVIKYCQTENINYIPLEFVMPTVTSLYRFYILKKKLDEIIEEHGKKQDKFFLMGNIKTYDFFYLAKELSIRKNIVYYKPISRQLKKYKPSKSKPIFFRGAIMKFFLKQIMDLDLIYYEGSNGDPVFGVDEKFLKKYNILKYKPNISSEDLILEVVKKSKSNYKEYDNFIIDKGPLSNYITFDSVKRLYEKLFELPLDFAFKKHPSPIIQKDHSETEFYEPFSRCDEIPRYIPAELFFNNVRKNVISLVSDALVTASKLQHLKSIALLELVEWHRDPCKKELKEYLIEASNNKILFPNNFEELKEILLS